MAVVCYAIAAVERPGDGTVTGVDMNVGQIAVSDGRHARILHAPDTRRLAAKIRRQQRRLARQRRGSLARNAGWPCAGATDSTTSRAAWPAAPLRSRNSIPGR